ncbi:Fie, partial [Drosophila busckii]
RGIWERLMSPISPAKLRTTAILTSLYQLLIAHAVLFLVLLCLAHAEQIRHVLEMDILDQKDSGFYNMSPFHNEMRLRTASQLADATENTLYALAVMATVYALTTISLFVGVFKNKPGLIIPWLVIEFLLLVAMSVFIFMFKDTQLAMMFFYQPIYFFMCYSLVLIDGFKWYIMHSYYQSLCTMNKLREIATVAIPCPAPGSLVPYQYRRENMYLGSNGYKHILTESPDGQC